MRSEKRLKTVFKSFWKALFSSRLLFFCNDSFYPTNPILFLEDNQTLIRLTSVF